MLRPDRNVGGGPSSVSYKHPGAPGRRWGAVLGAVGIALAALAVYASTLSFEFVYDDHVQIERNPRLREPGGLGRLFAEPFWGFYREGGAVVSNYYRPLFGALYALTARVKGAVPGPFHAGSVLLHAAVSLLVAAVALRLVPGKRAGPAALLAGLLFAVHPVHAEAVAWAGGQADLLCALFALAALGLHLRGGVSSYFAPLLYLASCLAKETGVALLLVLAVLELPRRGRGLLRLAPYALALAVYGALRVHALGGLAPGGGGGAVSPALAASLLGRYLAYLGVPFPARVLAPVAAPASWLSAWVLVGLLGVAGLAVAAWRAGRLETALPAAWILAFLLPPLAAGAPGGGAVFAERYLYLPSIGLAWLAGSLASRWAVRPGRPRVATAALVALLAACAALAVARAGVYRDDLSLFAAAVAGSPQSAAAHNNLGAALAARGDLAGAARQYEAAVRLAPAAAEAWANLGAARAAAGDRAGAMAAYGEALRRAPGSAAAVVGLARLHRDAGNAAEAARRLDALLASGTESYDALVDRALLHLRAGRPEAALPLLERALAALPDAPRGWFILAQARFNRGELEPAERAARAAIARGAGPGPRRLLARIRFRQGDREGARRWLEEALRIAPGDPDAGALLRSLQ